MVNRNFSRAPYQGCVRVLRVHAAAPPVGELMQPIVRTGPPVLRLALLRRQAAGAQTHPDGSVRLLLQAEARVYTGMGPRPRLLLTAAPHRRSAARRPRVTERALRPDTAPVRPHALIGGVA